MIWNYRIVEDEEGNRRIAEVYYDDHGVPTCWTADDLDIIDDAILLARCKPVMVERLIEFTDNRYTLREKR